MALLRLHQHSPTRGSKSCCGSSLNLLLRTIAVILAAAQNTSDNGGGGGRSAEQQPVLPREVSPKGRAASPEPCPPAGCKLPPMAPGLLAGSACACERVQALGGSLLSPSLCLLAVASIKHRKLEPFIWLFVARSPRPGSLPCPLQPLRLAARPASLTPRSLVCMHFPFGPWKAPL